MWSDLWIACLNRPNKYKQAKAGNTGKTGGKGDLLGGGEEWGMLNKSLAKNKKKFERS